MLVLEGILINVFETPKGVTKDGKEYGGESKIQVMYENTLANGEKRTEMETLTVADTSPYLNKKNSPVRVPVALNVYQGKAYLKRQFEPVWGGCRADEAHPKQGEKSAVFWRS